MNPKKMNHDELKALQDSDGHVWIPYKKHYDWWVEICWRCGCMKINMPNGRVAYKHRKFRFGLGRLKDNPPSPCRKSRKSECPI